MQKISFGVKHHHKLSPIIGTTSRDIWHHWQLRQNMILSIFDFDNFRSPTEVFFSKYKVFASFSSKSLCSRRDLLVQLALTFFYLPQAGVCPLSVLSRESTAHIKDEVWTRPKESKLMDSIT